jgi:rhamnose utilization protein RhaD (predicted bifunctional aldolase and dehydrogenase)
MDQILKQLIEMSHYLGDPSKAYAILGEGNTSARIDKDTFYVKASGTTLGTIKPEDFVAVSISRIVALIDDQSAGDDEVSQAFKEAMVDPNSGRRPSVETMLHAVLLQIPEYAFVGHTHAPYTNMLLCSKQAEEAVSGRVFPDQIVSMKHKSLYVPYVDPGLPLARLIRRELQEFIKEEGILPTVILMQNHGIITVGESPRAVTSCMDMAEKTSRIIVGTYALGGPNFMKTSDVERIFTRPDEAYRLKSIAG